MNQTHINAIIMWLTGLFGTGMSYFPFIPAAAQPFVLGFGLLLIMAGMLMHIQGLHLDLKGHKILIQGQWATVLQQLEGALELEPGTLTVPQMGAVVVHQTTQPPQVVKPVLAAPAAPAADASKVSGMFVALLAGSMLLCSGVLAQTATVTPQATVTTVTTDSGSPLFVVTAEPTLQVTATPVPSMILRYSNFSLSKEVVNGSIQGDFLSPMFVGGYTPIEVDNNVLTLGSAESIDLAYAFSHATMYSDGAGGVNQAPYWYVGVFGGGGIFGNGGVNLGHGTWGFFAGYPPIMGPLAAAIQEDLATTKWSGGLFVTIAFDVAGGAGVIQVH